VTDITFRMTAEDTDQFDPRTVCDMSLFNRAVVVHRMCKSEYQEEAVVYQLKQELHEKDLRLTDIQLEALSSAHQLEQLCETMNRMKVSLCLSVCLCLCLSVCLLLTSHILFVACVLPLYDGTDQFKKVWLIVPVNNKCQVIGHKELFVHTCMRRERQ